MDSLDKPEGVVLCTYPSCGDDSTEEVCGIHAMEFEDYIENANRD